jgi:hypothetical protein
MISTESPELRCWTWYRAPIPRFRRMSRSMMTSSATFGQPVSPRRTLTSPAFITLPVVRVGSWQCCMKASPVGSTACRTRRITPAEAITSPSSENPTAPACTHRSISASSSPRRPFVAAATGKTRQRARSWARRRTTSSISGVSSAGVVLGMQQTVVKPPATAAREPDSIVSLCSPPGSRRWTWGSIRPGTTRRPSASMTCASAGARAGPIARTRPPSRATSAISSRPEAGSITRPPRIRMLWGGVTPG